MVGHPADGAAAERLELASQVGATDPVHGLAGRPTTHGQDDGAVFECRRQAPDHGDHAGTPCRKKPRFTARRADDKSCRAGVPGVDDPAERQIRQEKRVRLIHDQCGIELLHGAIEGGDRDVGRGERSVGQRRRQVFCRRLAAALEG